MSADPKYKFYEPVKVRFNDTDLQGHVYFGQYYSFFDEGIEGYMAAIGYDYQMMLADNTDFLYVESHCSYKSPARWPEIIDVQADVQLGERGEHVGRGVGPVRHRGFGHLQPQRAAVEARLFQDLPQWLESVDAAFLESNYDPQLLASGDYPSWLNFSRENPKITYLVF